MSTAVQSLVDATIRSLVSGRSIAALAVLLLNDHVLKQTFPGPLTGKVSDFAGLFFFPVLLLTLALPLVVWLRRPALAVGPFLLTAVAFAALKVDPALSQELLGSIYALTGLSFGVVADPTDLLALASVLASYLCWRRELSRVPTIGVPSALARGRLVVVLLVGSVATVATSSCPAPSIVSLSAHAGTPGELYAMVEADTYCSREGSLYRTRDAGLSWRRIADGGQAMAADPQQPGTLYLLMDDVLYRYISDGPGPLPIGPPAALLRSNSTAFRQLAVTPRGDVYIWQRSEVLRYDASAHEWSRPDLPVDLIALTGGRTADFAVAGGRLWRSADDGGSWQAIGPLVAPDIAADPRSDSHLLAPTRDGLLRSVDGGTTWQRVWETDRAQEFPVPRWTIVFDPQHRERIYATRGGGVTPLLVSADGGATWRTSELDAWAVAVTAEPEHAVFISAGERGVYRQGSDWPTLEPWLKRSAGLPTR